jgi:ribonuclease HI
VELAGVLFISPDRKQLKYVLQILWQATNNEAKYEALIHGLWVATSLRIKQLLVYGDSATTIQQSSSIKSTRIETAPKTTWTPIVPKYTN